MGCFANLGVLAAIAYAFWNHSQFMLLAAIAVCAYHIAIRPAKKGHFVGKDFERAVLRNKEGTEFFEGHALVWPAFCEAIFVPGDKRVWDDPIRQDFVLEVGGDRYRLRLIRRGNLDAEVPRLHLYWDPLPRGGTRPSISLRNRLRKAFTVFRS